MRREWAGSVFQTPGRATYTAKFLDFCSGAWRQRKGLATRAQAREFLAGKVREYRARERGDFDAGTEQRKRPIADHVSDFVEHVRSHLRRRPRKRPDKHVRQLEARLVAAFEAMGTRSLVELTLDRAARYLNRLVDHDECSTKTRNDYMAALKQFGRWCEEGDRLLKNPLAALRKVREERREHRQALLAETVTMLAAAALARVIEHGMRGNRARDLWAARARALSVLVAFCTGLRNNELANLTWAMVNLDARTLALPAAITKSGRQDFLPLHAGLAWLLREVRHDRAASLGRPIADSELVCGYLDAKGYPTLPLHLAERIREDAEYIGLPVIDSCGRRLDLHSMRTSFANELQRRGVPKGVIKDLMRHGAADPLDRNYLHGDVELLRPYVDRIPFDVVHVAGLLDREPREEPKALRASERECASLNITMESHG